MPGRDGTGPMGMGRATRRGMGLCRMNGSSPGAGRYGCGRRFRSNFIPNYDYNPEEYRNMLVHEKNILENRLNLIKKELGGAADMPLREKEDQQNLSPIEPEGTEELSSNE